MKDRIKQKLIKDAAAQCVYSDGFLHAMNDEVREAWENGAKSVMQAVGISGLGAIDLISEIRKESGWE